MGKTIRNNPRWQPHRSHYRGGSRPESSPIRCRDGQKVSWTRGATRRKGGRLDVLATLVEAWEAWRYRLDLPDAIEAIRYHMEQNVLGPRDLIPFIGNRNRAYEVLSRKRPMTLAVVRRLHEGLRIPTESLIKVGGRRAA